MIGLLAQAAPTTHGPIKLGPIMPELIIAGTAILLMLMDSLRATRDQRPLVLLSLAGLAAAAAYSISLWNWKGPATVLGGMVAADKFAVFFRLVLISVAALGVLLSSHYLDRAGEARGEYYPLLLFATAGMTLITAAADLILVFLALEILSLSLYLMTGFSYRRMASAEASMKYFLLGAFSSAFLLYGIALTYGATGSTNLGTIAARATASTVDVRLMLIAMGVVTNVCRTYIKTWRCGWTGTRVEEILISLIRS